jgi:hypothetical protein
VFLIIAALLACCSQGCIGGSDRTAGLSLVSTLRGLSRGVKVSRCLVRLGFLQAAGLIHMLYLGILAAS